MDIAKMRVDVDAQEQGEWKDHPHFEGVRIQVRSIHSKAYKRKQRMLANREKADKLRSTAARMEAFERIERMATVALLVNWEGIDDGDKPLEYSKETAESWAQNPEYRVFFEGVRIRAAEVGQPDGVGEEDSDEFEDEPETDEEQADLEDPTAP